MRILGFVCALFLATLSHSYAADDLQAPFDEARFDWNGRYIGLQAGYGFADGAFIGGAAPINLAGDGNGFVGGIFAGLNHAMSETAIVGLEADINYSSVSGSVSNGAFVFPADVDYFGSIRARLGVVANEKLFYVTGGYAFMSGNHNVVPVAGAIFDDDLTGWTAGAGVEFLLKEDYVGRLEYRYYDFDENYAVNAQGLNVIAHGYEVDLQTVMFGVSRKF